MTDQKTLPASVNITPVQQRIQPVISPPGDIQPSPTQIGPLSIHSSSRTPSEAAADIEQPPLPALVAQRNAVQSLQVIPQPVRVMYLDRSRSNQQIPYIRQPMRLGVMGQRQPSQNSLVAFRQESLRGSRVVHVSSTQELPEVNRPLNAPQNPPNANRAIVIPIEHIEEEEQRNERNEEAEGNRQGEALEIQMESEAQGVEEDPHERRVSQVALLRVCMEFIFNVALLLIYGFAYLFVEDDIGVTGVLCIVISFVIVYLFGLFIKKKYSTREFDKVDFMLAVGNGISLIIYASMAYVKYEGTDIPLTPFSLFGILVLFGSCCKNSIEPPQPTTVIILVIKVIVWIQLFLVALQIDSLDIPWSTVFIPLYFGLLLLAFSSILIIFGSTFAFINIMRSEGVSKKLIVGSIWYILNALYSGVWLAILVEVAKTLDSNDGSIQAALAVGLIHGGVLFFYTLIFWKTLVKFQEFEVQSEMLVEPTNEPAEPLTQNEAPQRTQVRFQVSKDDKTHLMMISPSFYTYLKKHIKHKNQKDIQALQKELERVQMEKTPNPLALRAPHHTDIPMTVPPASPKGIALRREFSEGAAQMRQQQVPAPVAVAVQTQTQAQAQNQVPAQVNMRMASMKRVESTRSGENLCTICYDSLPNAVFMDCGHGGVCYECALELWKKSDYCILCRQKINKILKVVTLRPLNITKVVECTRKVVENV